MNIPININALSDFESLKTVDKATGLVDTSSVLSPAIEAIDVIFSSQYNQQIYSLREVLVLAENPQDWQDPIHRIRVAAKLSWGLRKSGEFLGQARAHYKLAYASRKKAESIAALETFAQYVAAKKAEGKDTKVTEEMRKHYVNIDVNVHAAVAKEAYMEAIIEQLQTYKQEFFMALKILQATAYGVHQQELNTLSSASVGVNDHE